MASLIRTRLSARPAIRRAIRERLKAALSRVISLGRASRGPGGGQVEVGDDDHEGQTHVQCQPDRPHAALHPGRRHQTTDHRGGGVVGVAVHPGGHRQGILRTGGGGGGHRQCRRRAEPPGDRYLRTHGDGQPVGAGYVDGHPGGEVRGIVGQVGALAFGTDDELRGGLHLHLDVPVER